MNQPFPKIAVDVDLRTVTIGDIIYSIDLLAGGLVTRPNIFAQMSISEPSPDGTRRMEVRLYHRDAMQTVGEP